MKSQNSEITNQNSKSLDSCFRRNDNVAVAATAKQKPPGEIRDEIY